MKKGFRNYPVDNLAKGINVENFPTELQDGEGLDIVNFELKGNELVSAKDHELLYDTGNVINGIKEIEEDIYWIANSNVYKNGDVLYNNNDYDITFSNVNSNPFSISIDGVAKVYKMSEVDEATALSTLLTTLQADFPTYTITGAGATKNFLKGGATISISNPQLVKTLTINGWDADAKIDIIIDGNTFTRDGSESATVSDLITWLVTQLTPATYYTKISGDILHIGRIDASAISISSNQYNRYTYSIGFKYGDTPTSGQYHEYTDTTIDGVTVRFDGSLGRPYYGHQIVRKLDGYDETINTFGFSSDFLGTGSWAGPRITPNRDMTVLTVTSDDPSQNMRITDSAGTTVLATATSDANRIATFNFAMTSGTTYRIQGFQSAGHHSAFNTGNGDFYSSVDAGHMYNVREIETYADRWGGGYIYSDRYNKSGGGTDSDYTEANTAQYFNQNHYFIFRASDYSSISFSAINHYTNPTSFPDDTLYISYNFLVEDKNHLASISVGTSSLTTFSVLNNSLGINSNAIYTIDVTPYGILLTSSGLGYSEPIFIDSAGTAHSIAGSSLVGEPTQGIVYKGKTLLVGSGGRLAFSKTYNTTTPADIYNFSGYNAGSQIVGEATQINGIITGDSGVYIFKDNEIWYSEGESDVQTYNSAGTVNGATFNFIFKKITNNGVKNIRAVAKANQDLFYFDYKNRVLRRIGYEENLTTLRDRNISEKVKEIFKEIPDDGTGGINYSPLIHVTYKYPNVYVFFPDENAITHSFFTSTAIPNRCLIYSVEKDGWTELDNFFDSIYQEFPFLSSNGIIATDILQRIYNLSELDSSNQGVYNSGEYTLGDDIRYKKVGEFQLVGELTGSKSIEIQLLRDGENIEISNEVNPNIRTITGPGRFVERIDLYEQGLERFEVIVGFTNGTGTVKISDYSFQWKRDDSFSNYY